MIFLFLLPLAHAAVVYEQTPDGRAWTFRETEDDCGPSWNLLDKKHQNTEDAVNQRSIFSNGDSGGKGTGADKGGQKFDVDEALVEYYEGQVEKQIKEFPLVIYSKPKCFYSEWAVTLLNLKGFKEGVHYKVRSYLTSKKTDPWRLAVAKTSGRCWNTTPQVFVCGRFLGGASEMRDAVIYERPRGIIDKACEDRFGVEIPRD